MIPMIFGPAEKEACERVCLFAREHPIDLAAMHRLIACNLAVGDEAKGFCTQIPLGYKVVFSIEQQPLGWVRHLSVAHPRPGALPHPAAVEFLMQVCFDFRGGLAQADYIGRDPERSDRRIPINVVQRLSEEEVEAWHLHTAMEAAVLT